MELSIWSITTSVCKFLLYICSATAIGGVSFLCFKVTNAQLRKVVFKYTIFTVLLAIIVTLLNFHVQVGAISESGFMGMFDTLYIGALWKSGIGWSVIYKVMGFSLLLLSLYLVGSKTMPTIRLFGIACFIFSLIGLGYSFTTTGHTAELSLIVRTSLSYHVVLALWWMGMLWPLRKSCSVLTNQELHALMLQFGKVASYLVFILLAFGLMLAFSLFSGLEQLLLNTYGQIFLLKIGLVCGLLMFAAKHKLRLVPRLLIEPASQLELSSSVKLELMVGILVLATTTILTTFVGPAHI